MPNSAGGWGWHWGSGLGGDPYADYSVYDTFTDTNGTDLDAHTAEKGTWTETDTGSRCDIQSNKAQITGVAGWGDPIFYAGTFARVAGQELVFTIKPAQTDEQAAIGLWSGTNFDPGAGGDKEHIMWFYSTGNIYCREAGAEGIASAYTTAEVECKIVLKATGATYYYDGNEIADLAVNSGDPLYVGFAAIGGDWDFDILTYK